MPQLRKKGLDRPTANNIDFSKDEEVFFCEITGEIFRDYEEFSEKMFLCNSMVWTCTMTGKSNLTYTEALESEQRAQEILNHFPSAMKLPLLYLTTKTQRTAFNDVLDDIYTYIRDRFFIGELIQCSVKGGIWENGKIVRVLFNGDGTNASKKNGECTSSNNNSRQYKYQVQMARSRCTVSAEQVRRQYKLTKDKCKLFLKHNLQQDQHNVFVLKPRIADEYRVDRIKLSDFFVGEPPIFDAKCKRKVFTNNGSCITVAPVTKSKQSSITAFLSKSTAQLNRSSGTVASQLQTNVNLLEQMRERCIEFNARKEASKQQKKEDDIRFANYMKEWYKPKEDLELEDQKILPVPVQVKMVIAAEYVADMLMIIEFVNSFRNVLKTRDYFPNGFTIDLAERALTACELSGPWIDLLHLLVMAVLNLQDNENSPDSTEASSTPNGGQSEAFQHYGLHLKELPFYTCTASEIIRLLLLESAVNHATDGANEGSTTIDSGSKDPGVDFCRQYPHIIHSLGTQHVCHLQIADRLQLICCLMHQILGCNTVRDVIDQRRESTRQARSELRSQQIAYRKQLQEFTATKAKLRKEEKDTDTLEKELNAIQVQEQKYTVKMKDKLREMAQSAYDEQVILGQDRAYRTYYKLQHVSGVFLQSHSDSATVTNNSRTCMNSIVEQIPSLVNADHKQTLAYMRKRFIDFNTSDKENNTNDTNPQSPLSTLQQHVDKCKQLLMCTTKTVTCPVHGHQPESWYFLPEASQLDQLMTTLNRRGIRESDLLHVLREDAEHLTDLIDSTPVALLNGDWYECNGQHLKVSMKRPVKYQHRVYTNPTMGYPVDMPTDEILKNLLCDSILEFEEKVYMGNLGGLSTVDRLQWRQALEAKDYRLLDRRLLSVDGGDAKSKCTDNDFFSALTVALLQVAYSINEKYLKKPLGSITSRKQKKNTVSCLLPHWRQSLLAAHSYSQLFLHYDVLDMCVLWSRSTLKARCKLCRRGTDSENMLLCDSCNSGFHLYCLKPKLKAVPDGDWYCSNCEPPPSSKKSASSTPLPVPKRKIAIFRDQEINSNDESMDVCVDENDDEDFQQVLSDGSTEWDSDKQRSFWESDVSQCVVCHRSDNISLSCNQCKDVYHFECVTPMLKRPPRGIWFCWHCKKHLENGARGIVNNVVKQRCISDNSLLNGRRRCATRARYMIHDFAQSLASEEGDESGKEHSPVNGAVEEYVEKTTRVTRRRDGPFAMPLHNAALHELLSTVMKNIDAWPFLRPVQRTEVPDYYDVIAQPMDFGTIKYKLNMGEYKHDADLMTDAVLVFQNCNTYNQVDDDVYKCGVRLLTLFQQKCRLLGLKLPYEMDYYDCNETQRTKRIRNK